MRQRKRIIDLEQNNEANIFDIERLENELELKKADNIKLQNDGQQAQNRMKEV